MLVVLFFIFFILIVIFIAVQLYRLTKKMVKSVKEIPSPEEPSFIREKPFSSYTVFQIETTGADGSSGEITQLVALRVRQGYEINSFFAYVSPTGDIPDTAGNATYITDSTAVCVPTLKPALESFVQYIGNDLLIGYDIASFDLPLLQKASSAELNRIISNPYVDVYQMAREANLPVNDNKLTSLADYFKLPVDNVHDTLAHCRTTKKCFERLLTKVQPPVNHPADISTPESE